MPGENSTSKSLNAVKFCSFIFVTGMMFPIWLAAASMLDPHAGAVNPRGSAAGSRAQCYTLTSEGISMSTDSNTGGLTTSVLEAKWKSNPDSEKRRDPFNLRMRRATSWLARAEQELNVDEPDYDAAFIFYWIAFNAAYSGNIAGERTAFKVYFGKILALKDGKVIFNEMSNKFAEAIR